MGKSSIQGLDHLQIAIPEGGEAKARSFYVDLHGFDEVAKPAVLAGRGGLWLRAPGVQLHLGVDSDFMPARKAHPAFLVSDLMAFRTRLETAGFAVEDEDAALKGSRRCHTNDGFGNRIELMEKIVEG